MGNTLKFNAIRDNVLKHDREALDKSTAYVRFVKESERIIDIYSEAVEYGCSIWISQVRRMTVISKSPPVSNDNWEKIHVVRSVRKENKC
jgi:hypothetical protein